MHIFTSIAYFSDLSDYCIFWGIFQLSCLISFKIDAWFQIDDNMISDRGLRDFNLIYRLWPQPFRPYRQCNQPFFAKMKLDRTKGSPEIIRKTGYMGTYWTSKLSLIPNYHFMQDICSKLHPESELRQFSKVSKILVFRISTLTLTFLYNNDFWSFFRWAVRVRTIVRTRYVLR